MTKLALSDEILMKIDKPARYIGNELNSVVKEKDTVDIRFVMCFPDVYEIGMSHLGIQILYDMLNKREDVWCERVYSPWPGSACNFKRREYPVIFFRVATAGKGCGFLGNYDTVRDVLYQYLTDLRSKPDSNRGSRPGRKMIRS